MCVPGWYEIPNVKGNYFTFFGKKIYVSHIFHEESKIHTREGGYTCNMCDTDSC